MKQNITTSYNIMNYPETKNSRKESKIQKPYSGKKLKFNLFIYII